MFLFCVSLFLTSATLGTYLFLRYVTLVRADGPRAGSVEWARELKSRVRGRSGNPAASDATQHTRSTVKDEPDHDDAKSEGSGDDNTVVIEDESPDRRFSFKELDAEGRESPVLVVKPLPSHDAPATELDRPSAQVAPV
ncbi:hypothetical protein EUX98_g8519 [Antrodiella citrinella]|uniref:Uncharacterized protein n=1 Tax=Antrodiella citrinella TaxID=2447956 RepID=A0A4S4M8I4_9APHY|nr:hypothetical protein EUX98_g8519 [Antrodiella citrinella]